ncbi:sugar ABC transporter substrate-binding protein [Gammaproteobacteria bacterium]|nr:sugar ABC transporter substrate-binding protein [Gammaproteobacteria bacterium]
MINRRDFLKYSALLAASSPFYSMLSAQEKRTVLRILYWGSPDRVRRSDKLTDSFNQNNSSINALAESTSNYWPKLNTSMAAGNMHDIIQLEPNTLPDYARRSVLIPLDELIEKKLIRTSSFAKGTLELGKIDGKIAGIAQGVNSFALIYDKDMYAKLGIDEPIYGLTWDEYARQAIEINKSSGKDRYWGAPSGVRQWHVFQSWLTQRGVQMFTEDQKIGFNLDDATEFYTYWDNLLKAGGCAPADVESRNVNTPDTSAMSTRNASSALLFSSQLTAFNALLPEINLGIAPYPIIEKGGNSGIYYRPSLTWSITRDCNDIEAAAKYIDFFINDIDAGKILEVERGIPANLEVRAAIMEQLGDYSKMTVEFTDSIADIVTPYPPAAPAGAIEMDTGVMKPLGDQLGFGKISVKQAATSLIAGVKKAIRQR